MKEKERGGKGGEASYRRGVVCRKGKVKGRGRTARFRPTYSYEREKKGEGGREEAYRLLFTCCGGKE